MKLNVIIGTLGLCLFGSAHATVTTGMISQSSSHFSTKLLKGDSVSVTYDLKRSPITRATQWFTYVLSCEASDRAQIIYPSNGKPYTTSLPVLTSNASGDFQKICRLSYDKKEHCESPDIDEKGSFTISNKSESDILIHCKLHDKYDIY